MPFIKGIFTFTIGKIMKSELGTILEWTKAVFHILSISLHYRLYKLCLYNVRNTGLSKSEKRLYCLKGIKRELSRRNFGLSRKQKTEIRLQEKH